MINATRPPDDPDIPPSPNRMHPTADILLAHQYITERGIEQLRAIAPIEEQGENAKAFTHSAFFAEHERKIRELERKDPNLLKPNLHNVIMSEYRRERNLNEERTDRGNAVRELVSMESSLD